MNTIFALIAGALVGALFARRREGATLDYVHYATVFALIFGLLSVIITLIFARAVG
ncbi:MULTISPECIES: hypothetical protein [Falsihalocynthiibacter]|uniref:hypothetical protein n=1 Tax=Falsihalocynthiibacter TaxID=2854182 RepID=UPI00146FE15A|nr:hypothetical protein [Falsihalocynthiibacter arcticus]